MTRIGRTLSPGHPDHDCDLIADTIVDEYLRRDPSSSLRVHVSGGKGALFVTGVVSSKADFDVGAVAVRVAASLGARNPVEPFVSLEPVPGIELLSATRTSRPVQVLGYATRETDERLPSATSLSLRLAKKLEDLRTQDPEWFWLEPAFDVNVVEAGGGRVKVFVNCAHGAIELSEVRTRVAQALESLLGGIELKVNVSGPLTAWSLDSDTGASGMPDEPYGSGLPMQVSPVGFDPSHPRKFGAWLSRSLARRVLERSDAKAVMVQAVYETGDGEPSHMSIRNERGQDLMQEGDKELMRYFELASRFRHGLNSEAARWGFVGDAALPWEGE